MDESAARRNLVIWCLQFCRRAAPEDAVALGAARRNLVTRFHTAVVETHSSAGLDSCRNSALSPPALVEERKPGSLWTGSGQGFLWSKTSLAERLVLLLTLFLLACSRNRVENR